MVWNSVNPENHVTGFFKFFENWCSSQNGIFFWKKKIELGQFSEPALKIISDDSPLPKKWEPPNTALYHASLRKLLWGRYGVWSCQKRKHHIVVELHLCMAFRMAFRTFFWVKMVNKNLFFHKAFKGGKKKAIIKSHKIPHPKWDF
jgi:hypothetical protein